MCIRVLQEAESTDSNVGICLPIIRLVQCEWRLLVTMNRWIVVGQNDSSLDSVIYYLLFYVLVQMLAHTVRDIASSAGKRRHVRHEKEWQ